MNGRNPIEWQLSYSLIKNTATSLNLIIILRCKETAISKEIRKNIKYYDASIFYIKTFFCTNKGCGGIRFQLMNFGILTFSFHIIKGVKNIKKNSSRQETISNIWQLIHIRAWKQKKKRRNFFKVAIKKTKNRTCKLFLLLT